jgi:hypothetical protein
VISNGIGPKSCFGQVVNYTLDSFATLHLMQRHLELRTTSRFSLVSKSLSMPLFLSFFIFCAFLSFFASFFSLNPSLNFLICFFSICLSISFLLSLYVSLIFLNLQPSISITHISNLAPLKLRQRDSISPNCSTFL